jgi:hypothetical protein
MGQEMKTEAEPPGACTSSPSAQISPPPPPLAQVTKGLHHSPTPSQALVHSLYSSLVALQSQLAQVLRLDSEQDGGQALL